MVDDDDEDDDDDDDEALLLLMDAGLPPVNILDDDFIGISEAADSQHGRAGLGTDLLGIYVHEFL